MTNLERRVAEAYERARNPPPMPAKVERSAAERQMRFVTELQLAQMGVITDVIDAHRRHNVRRWRKR